MNAPIETLGIDKGPVVSAVRAAGASLTGELSTMRRHLHRHPELSEREYATTQYLAGRVADLGLTARIAGDNRGVIADWDGSPGPRVVVRGDIDALPIHQIAEHDYQSTAAGVMHACGHDAHATICWGAAAILGRVRDAVALPGGSARFVFQPAEETSTGGPHMIAAGALEDVDAAVSVHVDPARPVGQIGVRTGPFTAGCDTFHIKIDGQAGHSSRPHLTGDALMALLAWIDSASVQLPRCHDVREPMVFNVGQINAGAAPNVIPATATAAGTLRCVSIAGRDAAVAKIESINRSIETRFPVKIDLQWEIHTPPVINHPTPTTAIDAAGRSLLGDTNVEVIDLPSMGAEDFAFFAARVPASMMRLGVAGPDVGSHPLHTGRFDLDERALVIGAQVLALATIELWDRPPACR